MLSGSDIRTIDRDMLRFIESVQPDTGIYRNNYSYACYVSLYLYALSLCAGRTVLDAACGFGYGSAILSRAAEQVTGIDLSEERIRYARFRYADSRVSFQRMDVTRTDFPDNRFDRVVSIETFEHIPEDLAHVFLSEMKRVLKPDGLLILSTPNRPVHTQITRTADHVNEVDVDTLRAFLSAHFKIVEMAHQRKDILDDMKTFYSVVKADRLRLRRLIPAPLRRMMHRMVAKDLTESVEALLPRLETKRAASVEDVKRSVLQVAVCAR